MHTEQLRSKAIVGSNVYTRRRVNYVLTSPKGTVTALDSVKDAITVRWESGNEVTYTYEDLALMVHWNPARR